jgi:hypothetical protein
MVFDAANSMIAATIIRLCCQVSDSFEPVSAALSVGAHIHVGKLDTF